MPVKNNKTALVKAVDYLSVQDYSVKQIYDKLSRCGYEQEEIKVAIDKLVQKGYLDDADLCDRQSKIYLKEKRYSVMMIKQKLLRKGFSPDMVNKSLTSDFTIYEKNTAVCILQKHLKKTTDTAKSMQYLYRKGFSPSSIRYAVDILLTNGYDANI
ncbi:regulatory protein RecX [Pectinatus sottacetonis]|uniref:regulatory protein RecX n=1 Tax=Pectinatus sottacetonis TaxID=1002795 RepID=UPI0018C7670B|nr:regulatory protein RecX [Pectinatus sottacetonis]